MRSGVTSLTRNWLLVSAIDASGTRLHFFSGFEYFLDGALHVEGLFRNAVVLAFNDFLEAANRVLDLDVAARESGECLRDVEGLRQEFLHLAGARDGELVFFRKFV